MNDGTDKYSTESDLNQRGRDLLTGLPARAAGEIVGAASADDPLVLLGETVARLGTEYDVLDQAWLVAVDDVLLDRAAAKRAAARKQQAAILASQPGTLSGAAVQLAAAAALLNAIETATLDASHTPCRLRWVCRAVATAALKVSADAGAPLASITWNGDDQWMLKIAGERLDLEASPW